MRRLALACATLFAALLLPVGATAQQAAPYDLANLHPDVRTAALAARENAARAEAAAIVAREVEQRARAAAERARNGDEGHRAYDFAEDSQQRRYEGEWVEGQRATGVGVLTFGAGPFAGDQYAGTFRRGSKFGPGVYIHSSGARYEGDYVNGKRERFGVYQARNFRHVGRSCCDEFEGAAIYYFNNGERYEGEFAENRPNGFGVLWASDGRVKRSGIWRDGHLRRRLRPSR
jgi:hypothetical protein